MTVARAALWIAVGATALAQDDEQRARAELARTQQARQQVGAEIERLTELRMRHDLGLPLQDADGVLEAPGPATTESIESLELRLRQENASTANLLSRYEKAKAESEQLRTAAAARVQQTTGGQEWIAVPQPGARQPTDPAARVPARARQAIPPAGDPAEPAAPAGEVADAVHLVPNLDPVKARIHGSSDHARVAQSLYRAGLSRVDLAATMAAQGHTAAAAELDDKARDLLRRALDELAPLLAATEPAFADLFWQGKCRELLFRIAQRRDGLSLSTDAKQYQLREQEVREPFLQITARDVVRRGDRGGTEVLGPWGRAAQTAMEHFRWMNLHAGFEPRTPVDSITWEGERHR